ncbi:MAG: patatin-like phospholipase family protein, partial [Duncaniella sp.]|nr:patatin-like phospholipase family protein [Duncaniella sp.]
MKRFITLAATFLCLSSLLISAKQPTVGLVLSGGGAKGIAHIGAIKALEDNDIPIDYVTGTSMGAIVGSLYAAGFTPEQMMDLIKSPGFSYWSTGRINPADTYYFLRKKQTPSFVRLNLGKDSTQITSILPVSLINPIPMNMAFPEIYSAYTAQCKANFDNLFVPFRCCTSDVYAKHKVVLKSGSLADAVRMSMSFPMIFEPLDLDGVPMYDGGIYDNFPVDVMVNEFNPDQIIGISVASDATSPNSRNPMSQLEEMIMQPNNYPFPYNKGWFIHLPVQQFGLLEFGKADEIYEVGYKQGLLFADSIKATLKAPARSLEKVNERRRTFASKTPEIKIREVNVTGGKPSENAYLEQLFEKRKGERYLTFPQARAAYYRAVSSDKIQNLVPYPQFNPSDTSFTLNYKAVIKDDFNVGVGGYITSSTNSMLFFNAGYSTLSFKSIDTNLSGWIGQSYLAAQANFAYTIHSHIPSAFMVSAVSSRFRYHETAKMFYQINDPNFIQRSESYVKAFYTAGPTLNTKVDAGVGFGHLTDTYHSHVGEGTVARTSDHSISDIFMGELRWEKNTLDNLMAPTSGAFFNAKFQAIAGRYELRAAIPEHISDRYHQQWLQGEISAEKYFRLSRAFSLGITGKGLLSSRKLLPTYEASIVAADGLHP